MNARKIGFAASTLALVALAAFAGPSAPARAENPSDGRALESTLQELARHVVPRTAVVYGAIGLGSGAVVDHEGTVVTNAHVALAARIAILEFADGRRVVARRRGIDFEKDLAVLEPEEPLKAAVPCFELGRGRPAVGTWVAGVGYPGGPRGDLRPTFSVGKVVAGPGLPSAIVPGLGLLDYSDAIRTDVAIYEGNSGGPLVGLDGRLLGINGAFEPTTGSAFSIPLDVVVDRLRILRHGVIRFPGGREFDDSNPLVAALGRQLDPLVKQLVERVHAGFDPSPKGDDGAGNLIEKESRPEGDDAAKAREQVVQLERASPRSKALLDSLPGEPRGTIQKGSKLAAKLEGGILATRVSRRHLVAKASFVAAKNEWVVEPSQRAAASAGDKVKARVVAVAPEHDLALLELDEETDVALPEDAGARPAGSIVASADPSSLFGPGIVTVGPRPIPEAVSMRIAGNTALAMRALKIIRSLKPLAKRLGGGAEKFLNLDALEQMIETSLALGTGNDPRGYAHVLSHDGALLPREAGAPLVDLEGRLVGVNVSNANYGTWYAVPIKTIREVFWEKLGRGAIVPEKVGKAKLF
jgi:S1-C subfamily serine protease